MIKSLLLSICTLFLAFTGFAIDGVKVTQNIPASVKQGSEFRVDVVIEKKGIEGFAKLQFELPVGLSASSIENKGAAFTFKEQFVNFVWMSLPSDETFTISYNVSVSSSVFGADSVSGKFNYILNNEKQTYTIPGAIINIQLAGDGATAQNITNVTNTQPDATNNGNNNSSETNTNVSSESNSNNVASSNNAVTENAPKEEPKVTPKEEPKPVEKPVTTNTSAKIAPATAVPGVVFKVQVAALANAPKDGTFSALSDVSSYKAPDGLNKYYSGSFSSYTSAKQHLESVKGKGFEGAFIAAFKNGSPISVKEALGK